MGPTIGDIFLGLLPMLLLIGAWFFFMWRMKSPSSIQGRMLELTRRNTEALERIAAALERRQ
ncbi:MAG TPA: hypothetical protein VEA80_16110 [Vitreimonas sp.]|uniref:hypothetical protein n=1 Tax=Vitreimonas sp. TaxID=3069702 RepID=UPI002D526AC5|nr:hypothetical protein [Vitreimonas sp.]HYD89001.1 hypothetical protein [Vitreimonas sp.]